MLYFGNEGTTSLNRGLRYGQQTFEIPQVIATNRVQGGTGTNVQASASVSWLTVQNNGGGFAGGYRFDNFRIDAQENATSEKRNGRVIFAYTDDNGRLFAGILYVTQSAENSTFPVWSDVYHYVDDVTEADYDIHVDGGNVYSGKVFMNPLADPVKINISRIAQDYLQTGLGSEWVGQDGIVVAHEDAAKEFEVIINGEYADTYRIINDWSYDNFTYGSPNQWLSKPIDGKADSRMYLFFTTFPNVTGSTSETIDEDGVMTTYAVEGDVPSTIVLRAATHVYAHADANTGYDVRYCAPYALYYRNRYGGYDSFMVQGNMVKSDDYTQYTVMHNYDANSIEWGNGVYHTTISPSYKLYTGWLSDSQSENLAFNLLSSNEVYLHILDEDKIIPVVLSAKSSDYKTRMNQGNGMVNYTITATASHMQQNL